MFGRRTKEEELKIRARQEKTIEDILEDMDCHEMCRHLSCSCKELKTGDRERKVFVISPKTALKFALSDDGIAKNLCEMAILRQLKKSQVVPEIRRAASDGRWYMVERCSPVSQFVAEQTLMKFEKALLFDCEFTFLVPEKYQETVSDPFYEKLILLVEEAGLGPYDILDAENWGRSKDGRLVFLGFGPDSGSEIKAMFSDFEGSPNEFEEDLNS